MTAVRLQQPMFIDCDQRCTISVVPGVVVRTSNALGWTMEELAGRTAFVTGGASGIGLALGRAFAEAGMKVMLADIESSALDVAVESLRAFSPNVRSVPCDVA